MSQSQHSDFSSSRYDSDLDLSYFAPSNPEFSVPYLPSSQPMFDTFDPEFLRPPPPPVIPSCLRRIGPDRTKAYVLYDIMFHTNWVDWWLETDFGKKSKIRWDSNHQAVTWSHYDQVAHGSDGAPKIMCKRCGQILEHPYTLRQGTTQRQGTSTMAKHLKTTTCVRFDKARRSNITNFMKKTVSLVLL